MFLTQYIDLFLELYIQIIWYENVTIGVAEGIDGNSPFSITTK